MAVTVEQVAAWGNFKAPTDASLLALLESTTQASIDHLAAFYYITDVDDLTPVQLTAVLMQTARLWKRRETPEGRSAFGGDVAVTITAFDPDIHALLRPRPAIA